MLWELSSQKVSGEVKNTFSGGGGGGEEGENRCSTLSSLRFVFIFI